MDYNNNPMNSNNNNLRTNQIRNESEDQRTRRQNRIGLVILGLAVLAFVGGFAATMDKNPASITQSTETTTAANMPATGATEAAIAPAAGNATAQTSGNAEMTATATPEAASTTMAATTATTTPEPVSGTTATGTTPSTTAVTEPVTENPKVYTSEESCRGSVNGACQPISGGWTPVNPAPEKTAVPEAIAPAAGTTAVSPATTPSDSNED